MVREELKMTLQYYCRHCGTKLGAIDQPSISTEMLGFHKLSDVERQEMIQYDHKGNIQIKTICEDCQEALERNPDFHQYDYLIH